MSNVTLKEVIKKKRSLSVWINDTEEKVFLLQAYNSDAVRGSAQSAGLDLVCPREVIIPGGARGVVVGMGIKAIATVMKNTRHDIIQQAPTSPEEMYKRSQSGLCIPTSTRKWVERPQGFNIYLRSSTPIRTPLRLGNHVGVVDADYRGEIKLIVDNFSQEDYKISKGDRIAQICLPSLKQFKVTLVDNPPSWTQRGEGGLGSSGVGVPFSDMVFKAVEESTIHNSIIEPAYTAYTQRNKLASHFDIPSAGPSYVPLSPLDILCHRPYVSPLDILEDLSHVSEKNNILGDPPVTSSQITTDPYCW